MIAPRIETVEEAAAVSRACRFPPRGQRSQLACVPQLGMRPTPVPALNATLDKSTIVQILLETPAGIANVNAIAQLDGVDMIAIGANDLTAELGAAGCYDQPPLRGAVMAAADACRQHDKLLMVGGVSDLAILADLMSLGVCPLLLVGMDTDLLYAGAESRAEKFHTWHRSITRDSSPTK